MDTQSLEYLWQVVKCGLVRNEISSNDLADQFFSGRFDLPKPVDDMLAHYFVAGNDFIAQQIAHWLVERFAFSGVNPERHLVLVAELLRREALSPFDTAKLVRMDESNFSLLTEQGREVVRIAEILDEDGLLESQSELVTDLLKSYKCLSKA